MNAKQKRAGQEQGNAPFVIVGLVAATWLSWGWTGPIITAAFKYGVMLFWIFLAVFVLRYARWRHYKMMLPTVAFFALAVAVAIFLSATAPRDLGWRDAGAASWELDDL
jgi:hypothetical protein